MVEIECPVEGCDFSGPLKSVEGHISASNGNHKGEAGANFREELRDRAEEALEDLGGGGAEKDGDGDDEKEMADGTTETETERGKRRLGAVGPLAAGGGALLSSSENGVDGRVVVIGLVALLLLASAMDAGNGSSTQSESQATGNIDGQVGAFEP